VTPVFPDAGLTWRLAICGEAAEPVPGRRHDVSKAPVKKIADGLQCVSRFRKPLKQLSEVRENRQQMSVFA